MEISSIKGASAVLEKPKLKFKWTHFFHLNLLGQNCCNDKLCIKDELLVKMMNVSSICIASVLTPSPEFTCPLFVPILCSSLMFFFFFFWYDFACSTGVNTLMYESMILKPSSIMHFHNCWY